MKIPVGVQTISAYPFRHGNLVVQVLGKNDAVLDNDTDWKDVVNNPQDNHPQYIELDRHARTIGASKIVWPKAVHGREISSSQHLKPITAPKNPQGSFLPVLRRRSFGESTDGAEGKADGAIIGPGEVYALASADCPLVALNDPETRTMVAVHFSRETGVDKDILGTALERFTDQQRQRLVAVITLGIAPEHFDHPWDHHRFGDMNRERSLYLLFKFGDGALVGPAKYGCINLRWIAAARLISEGVKPYNIYADGLDTYGDPDYWSHKRGDVGRNLVLAGNTDLT